jgi:hypothetical protein
MSKLLKLLLKNSLLPSAAMIVGKLLGLYLAISFFDMDVSLGNEIDGLFSVQIYIQNTSDTVLANTISNSFMLSFLLIGYLYYITRYILYKRSTENPKTIVKLTKFNLVKWVTDKNTVFIKILPWGVFLIAGCAIVITSTINKGTSEWLGLLAFFIVIGTIWSLIRTFEIETAKIYPESKEQYF